MGQLEGLLRDSPLGSVLYLFLISPPNPLDGSNESEQWFSTDTLSETSSSDSLVRTHNNENDDERRSPDTANVHKSTEQQSKERIKQRDPLVCTHNLNDVSVMGIPPEWPLFVRHAVYKMHTRQSIRHAFMHFGIWNAWRLT